MHRFYCPKSNISRDRAIISEQGEVHHLRDVLRVKEKDRVSVFDERGNVYECVVTAIGKRIQLRIQTMRLPNSCAEDIKVTVACAIPKRAKMDDIIDKLTQLGVERIMPLLSERVIVRLDRDKYDVRLGRWKKIAMQAAKQSRRVLLPTIEPIRTLPEVLTAAEHFDIKLMPTLSSASRKTPMEAVAHLRPRRVFALIGPEGDFTSDEVQMAEKAGCIPVSLGKLVLRVDTAAIAVVSFLRLVLL